MLTSCYITRPMMSHDPCKNKMKIDAENHDWEEIDKKEMDKYMYFLTYYFTLFNAICNIFSFETIGRAKLLYLIDELWYSTQVSSQKV